MEGVGEALTHLSPSVYARALVQVHLQLHSGLLDVDSGGVVRRNANDVQIMHLQTYTLPTVNPGYMYIHASYAL